MKLKTLSIFTTVLVIISVFIFINENKRGSDLILGSDYIKGFDIEKIHKIVINFKDSKEMALTRYKNKFLIESHKSYPAASAKVNDLIYKIASIQVKEKITSNASETDLKKYELNEKLKQYRVEFYDKDGKKTISFQVGKSHKGKGNYLLKNEQKEVYLSMNNLSLDSSYKDFIDPILLNLNKDDIAKIQLKSNKEIELIKEDQELVLVTPKAKQFKKEKIDEYYGSFSDLKFNDYFKMSDSDVQNLNFNKYVKIQLKNKLIYNMVLAQNKDRYFVKLNVWVDEMPERIRVSRDAGKEELSKIEDMIKAQGNAQKINMEKANWVYQIEKSIYENILKKEKFFL